MITCFFGASTDIARQTHEDTSFLRRCNAFGIDKMQGHPAVLAEIRVMETGIEGV